MNENVWEGAPVNEQEGRVALADQVRAARKRMYRTVTKAVANSEASRGAWDAVEGARPVKDFTLTAIEVTLGWPEGYATALLEGRAVGAPVPGAVAELTDSELRTLRQIIGDAAIDDALRGRLLEDVDRRERGAS